MDITAGVNIARGIGQLLDSVGISADKGQTCIIEALRPARI